MKILPKPRSQLLRIYCFSDQKRLWLGEGHESTCWANLPTPDARGQRFFSQDHFYQCHFLLNPRVGGPVFAKTSNRLTG